MELKTANAFLKDLSDWARAQSDIAGLLLVGSHAHGTSRPDSDIDVFLFTSKVDEYFSSRNWLNTFDVVKSVQAEEWGSVRTLRAFFRNVGEVEFNLTGISWASLDPIDDGTFRVVADGAAILYDPKQSLAHLLEAVKRISSK